MTLHEVLTRIADLKPNGYDQATLVSFINDLEGKIYHEIIKWHNGAPDEPPMPYDADGTLLDELLVKEPYSDIYVKYLSAQIDYFNAEYARYENSMTMFNSAYSAFADWYTRENMPLSLNHVEVGL